MDDHERAQDATLHASISPEPEVLHGPWTQPGCNYPLRVVKGDGLLSAVVQERGEMGAWTSCGQGHWAVAAELARLAAENVETRNAAALQQHLLRQLLERLMAHAGEDEESEGALDVLVRVLAERDRLRALIARMREAFGRCLGAGDDAPSWRELNEVILDRDGEAAEAWLQSLLSEAQEEGRRRGLREAAERCGAWGDSDARGETKQYNGSGKEVSTDGATAFYAAQRMLECLADKPKEGGVPPVSTPGEKRSLSPSTKTWRCNL